MKKIKILVVIAVFSVLTTACSNGTAVNIFDYSHKSAVIFEMEGDSNEKIKDVLDSLPLR